MSEKNTNIINSAGKNHMKPIGRSSILSTHEGKLNVNGCCINSADTKRDFITKITLFINKKGNKSRLTFFFMNEKKFIFRILSSGCVYANRKPDKKKKRGM